MTGVGSVRSLDVHGLARSSCVEYGGPAAFEEVVLMASIGPLEIAVVLIIALVVLGPKRLPDMGRSVGRGMREFKEAVTGGSDEPREIARSNESERARA